MDGIDLTWQREVGTALVHADRAHLLQYAQPLEDRQVHRQQRFADVEARVAFLLQQQHAPAAARQQRGGGGAGGAATDHQHVGLEGLRHR